MARVVVVVLALMMISVNGFAFGLPKAPAMGSASGKSAVSIDDALSMQNDLLKAYANGVKLNCEAQSIMSEALGLDSLAADLKAESDGLSETNVDGLEASVAKSKAATDAISKKMAESKELSAEAKGKVAKSLVPLGLSLLSYKSAAEKGVSALDGAKSVIENAPMTQKLSAKSKLDPILSIAPSLPGDLSNVIAMAGKYVEFAKSNDIEPPKGLNDALGD